MNHPSEFRLYIIAILASFLITSPIMLICYALIQDDIDKRFAFQRAISNDLPNDFICNSEEPKKRTITYCDSDKKGCTKETIMNYEFRNCYVPHL